MRVHHPITLLSTSITLCIASDFYHSFIHIAILFFKLTLLLRNAFNRSAIFLLIALPINLPKGLQSLQIGQKHVLSHLSIELDQSEELNFQLIENFDIDSSYTRIEGVLIVKIIEVLRRDHIGCKHDPMHIFFMEDEERIVLLDPIDQHQRIDEYAYRGIHVLEHS